MEATAAANPATSAAATETSPATAELIDRYDPFSEALHRNLAATYRALRDACPVHGKKFGPFDYPLYTITRHADVKGMLKDPALWSSRYGQAPMYTEEKGLVSDDPQHGMYRQMLNPIFSTRRVNALKDKMAGLIDGLIDSFIAAGECDLHASLNTVFPLAAGAELLGVEPERHAEFCRWTQEYIMGQLTGDTAMVERVRGQIAGYYTPRLDAHRELLRRDPSAAPDDAIHVLVTAQHPEGRPFTNEEICPPLNNLITGVTDTSAFLMSNCLHRLLGKRALWEQLCADPSLAEVALEETLRLDPPIMGVFRTNTRPVTMHGVDIPFNSKVQMCFASANRDERVWDDPDTFRLDRSLETLKQNTLGFGHGVRFCIGAHLVRLDTAIALRRLAERLPSLRLAGEPGYFRPLQMNGINRLPVAWD